MGYGQRHSREKGFERMQVRNRVIAGAMVGLTLAVAVRVTAQAQPPTQPPVQTPPAQPPIEGHGGPPPPGTQPATPAPTPAQPRPGSGQARFPAHQRPVADPVVVERGRGVYSGVCSACHGVDARGGQLGGPNLLRSQLMLNDRDGELMLPVVQNGRPGTTMPPFPTISADDIKAMAAWIHSLQAQGSNQGGPPPGEEPVLNILVGDAKAGEAFFTATCAKCHSATGDLAGIATRISDPKVLQNTWVSGGLAGARGGGRASGAPPRPATPRNTVTAKVTLPGRDRRRRARPGRRLHRHGRPRRRHATHHSARRRCSEGRDHAIREPSTARCSRPTRTRTCTT